MDIYRNVRHILAVVAIALGPWTVAASRCLPADDITYDTVDTQVITCIADSAEDRSIRIEFPVNRWAVEPEYSDNAAALAELKALLVQVRSNPYQRLDSICVSGYASPDGYLPTNRELSLRRAVSLYRYLGQECGVPDSLMHFGQSIVPWDAFRELVAATDYPWRDEAMAILTAGSDHAVADNTRRMRRLKRLRGGEPWRVVRRQMLPRLRSAMAVSTVITSLPTPVDTTVMENDIADIHAGSLGTDTLAIIPQITEHAAPARRPRDYDRFAIKTNGLYLAAGVANIGAEVAVDRHWSIDLPLVYSPYTIARSYRMRFLYLQPEVRYWPGRALHGHFVGVHGHAGVFNVSVDRANRYQSEKGFHGGGLSYGYSLPVGRRWSIEFTAGVGYAYTKYCTYYNVHNGMKYRHDVPYHYWGLDKLAVNIVYRFGDLSGKVHRDNSKGKEVQP